MNNAMKTAAALTATPATGDTTMTNAARKTVWGTVIDGQWIVVLRGARKSVVVSAPSAGAAESMVRSWSHEHNVCFWYVIPLTEENRR